MIQNSLKQRLLIDSSKTLESYNHFESHMRNRERQLYGATMRGHPWWRKTTQSCIIARSCAKAGVILNRHMKHSPERPWGIHSKAFGNTPATSPSYLGWQCAHNCWSLNCLSQRSAILPRTHAWSSTPVSYQFIPLKTYGASDLKLLINTPLANNFDNRWVQNEFKLSNIPARLRWR